MFARLLKILGYCLLTASSLLVLFVLFFTVVDGGWGALVAGSNPLTPIGFKNWGITLLVLAPGPIVLSAARFLANRKTAGRGPGSA